jgi:Leu/Phe-tRNA-protein transferase
MNEHRIRADSFLLKKRNLRIYRIAEPDTAVLLWTAEQQAVNYIQKLHIQKLFAKRKEAERGRI